MPEADHSIVPIKDYVDQRAADLMKLGGLAAAAIIACGWVAFALNGKALTVALTASERDLESHNGKIRQWEITQAEERAKLATKEEIEPLKADYRERRGGAITAGKFWTVISVVSGLMLTAGIGLAKLLG